jgi:hypothetical protein
METGRKTVLAPANQREECAISFTIPALFFSICAYFEEIDTNFFLASVWQFACTAVNKDYKHRILMYGVGGEWASRSTPLESILFLAVSDAIMPFVYPSSGSEVSV